MNKRLAIFIICHMLLVGCGLLPRGGGMVSDTQMAAGYILYGGCSKGRLKYDFGKPDEIQKTDETEIWIYHNRQEGRTFKFHFDKKGKLISVET